MNYQLALDALQAAARIPVSPQLWQRLCKLINQVGPQQRAVLLAKIAALELQDRNANWLRYSALAYLSGNLDFFVRQSEFCSPDSSADMIMTFLGLVWFHALTQLPTKQDLVQLMNAVQACRLQQNLAEQLPELPVAPRKSGTNIRVAIYTPEIMNPRHGGTSFALNIMSVLSGMGMECQGFAAQEVAILPENTFRGGEEYLRPPVMETESLSLKVAGSMQLKVANPDFSLHYRLVQMQAAIHSYNPDVIVFVGLLSPLVHRLYLHYPIVGLCVHAMPPLVPVDVWLSADAEANPAVWDVLPPAQLLYYPFRFWPIGQTTPVARETLQIAAGAVLLITAGYRLAVAMRSSWLQDMQRFIDTHEQVHWLLVGVKQEQQTSAPQHPRFHYLEPQQHLESWLASSDIYVNPPCIGGGGSVAMAMEQGLPVLALAGSDGADKVGPRAVDSMADYFAQLTNWVTDSAVRCEVGAELKASFHARLDISSAPAREGALQAINAAIASFTKRNRNNDA